MTDPKYKGVGDIEDRVIEECSEVIKEICKARRFGYLSYHPRDPEMTPHIVKIALEMADLVAVLAEYTKVFEAWLPEGVREYVETKDKEG